MNASRPEQGRRLLDEALRLLDMAQATRPAGARQDADAAGAPGPTTECNICPICRGIAYLREVDPQAVERLTGAVADVATAVRDLLGATTPQETRRCDDGTTAVGPDVRGDGGDVPRVRIQQIDVTD